MQYYKDFRQNGYYEQKQLWYRTNILTFHTQL